MNNFNTNIIAVDFYTIGDLMRVVDELNRR